MTRQSLVLKTLGGFAALGAAGVAAYVTVVRPWHRRWGATDEEVARTIPGDELVLEANFATTRAITIDAPPVKVWPWLIQIGQGRGGFYSYDALENMMDLDIHSADQILPECQDLKVGDVIPLMPEGDGYEVAEIEPNRHLVLFVDDEGDGPLAEAFQGADAASTWTFLLEELDGERTRLVVRWRAWWNLRKTAMAFVMGIMLDPIEFIMERKMMRGIKERAETAAKKGGADANLPSSKQRPV